jgi:hypothetical protein
MMIKPHTLTYVARAVTAGNNYGLPACDTAWPRTYLVNGMPISLFLGAYSRASLRMSNTWTTKTRVKARGMLA